MKILFCDNSLRELLNFRGDVISDYAEHGAEVVLLAPRNCDINDTSCAGVRTIPIDFNRSGMNPFKECRYFFRLWKIYRKERPDYIFHYTIKPNIYGSLAARLCRIPSTAVIAGLGYVFNKGGFGCRIARALYRFAMRYPEYVLVLNEHNKSVLLENRIVKSSQMILLKGGEGVNLDKFKA
ncbi:MAG: hypothetical protein K1V70_00345 [Alistipes sp.]|jgi:hypothetical protein